MHPNILNKNQLVIVKKLKLPKAPGFYLAGGTALALQIGHRTSIDFDFYSQRQFSSLQLAKDIKKTFPKAKMLFTAEDTLKSIIGVTELSFFYYSYQLLEPLKQYQNISIASLADVAAMKLAAIIQRGTRRDFIDIYFLLNFYTLGELINFAIKKYPGYQPMLILRALIYLEDAENEKYPRPIKVLDPDFSWQKAKDKIFAEVKRYQLSLLEKRY